VSGLERRLHRLLAKAGELGGRLVLELEEDGDVYAGLLDPDGVELAAGRGPGVDEATAGLSFRLGEGRVVELDELRTWLAPFEVCAWSASPSSGCWSAVPCWPVRRWGHGPCPPALQLAAGAPAVGADSWGFVLFARPPKKQKRRRKRR